MSIDRFAQLRRICLQAMNLPETERDAFLDERCGNDAELRREIGELLAQRPEELPVLRTAGPEQIVARDQAGRESSAAGTTSVDSTATHPERIGRYPVLGELGRGGMGVAYLAEDPRLERRIAVKVLPENVVADRQVHERIAQEAKLLVALNHPNIATIYSLEEAGDQQFLTLELVEGETLHDRRARHE